MKIEQVAPTDAAAQVRAGAALLDVREPDEWAEGIIANAICIARGDLLARIAAALPDRARPIVVYCRSGRRSLAAIETLSQLGYASLANLDGGILAWQAAGLPVARVAASGLTEAQRARYARHLALPEIGAAGQEKLLRARVALVGAGGLGSPAALYLAAAGVGQLTVIDGDVVELSNLQRQVLHSETSVGQPKVSSAQRAIASLNSDVVVHAVPLRLTATNATALLAEADVIVDGSDNFTTRYVVNDAALLLGRPVVHAAIYRYDGQIAVFPAGGRPCYRCLFPAPPPADLAPSCGEAGVLGVLPCVMGVLQATETIKLLLGLGTGLAGRVLLYDAWAMTWREVAFAADPACPACGDAGSPARCLANS